VINYNATVALNVKLKQVWFNAGESCKQLIWLPIVQKIVLLSSLLALKPFHSFLVS